MVKTIDLQFQGQASAVASFLLETSKGPVLIETGPYSTFTRLKHQIEAQGYQLEDIKHVFVTHIHLDHAGAAWALARHGAKIYVHPVGLPHLENPERLMVSARRIYQEKMDSLWGEMQPIPSEQLVPVEDGQRILLGDVFIKARHTPGHAIHHIAWEFLDFAFTGDVGGVKIGENGPVMPPCPPPDINLEDWSRSLAYLKNRRYKAIYLTHFGKVTNVREHLHELQGRLTNWANWVKPFWEKGVPMGEVVPDFEKYVGQQLEAAKLSEEDKLAYSLANPAEMSVGGLYRYWSKRS